MTPAEFDSIFQGLRTRFAEIGFTEDKKQPLELVVCGPHGCLVEFGGERYSHKLSVSMSGSFSQGEWVVFPFIADAVDPGVAKRLRTSGFPRDTVLAILDFLEAHLDRLVADPDRYLKPYREILARSGVPRTGFS